MAELRIDGDADRGRDGLPLVHLHVARVRSWGRRTDDRGGQRGASPPPPAGRIVENRTRNLEWQSCKPAVVLARQRRILPNKVLHDGRWSDHQAVEDEQGAIKKNG